MVDLAARFLNLADRLGSPNNSTTAGLEVPDASLPEPRVRAIRQVQKRLADNDILALVEAYRSGSTVARLTRDFGINRTTVLQHLQRHGVSRRPHIRKLTDRQVAEAVQLYEEGWSYSRLGKKYFVDAETMRKELAKAGVQSRTAGRPPAS